MSSYLDVQYAPGRRRETGYPQRLVDHLCEVYAIHPDSRVLELGCGRGDFVRAWTRRAKITGCDQEITFEDAIYADLTGKLPFPDESFDVVFSKSVVEHLADPTSMMQQTWRVLKPGGLVILMTPDWRSYWLTFFDDFTHVRPYDVVSAADLLRSHGFKDVTARTIFQDPALWHSPLRATLATAWYRLAPLRAALALHEATGWGWAKWWRQKTVIADGRRPPALRSS